MRSDAATDLGRPLDFLSGGGEMGALFRAHDWSATPLGPVEGWPQSLRSAVGLMLANRHLMFVAWGPELAFLYNDGYRPVFGRKHPGALGQPFREVWSEIWDDIEPLVDTALAGEATWSEDLHLVMERNGYPEDCWYTFSYSPIRDESGAVAGLFCAGSETTKRVQADRRQAFLLGLEKRLRVTETAREALDAACEALGRALGGAICTTTSWTASISMSRASGARKACPRSVAGTPSWSGRRAASKTLCRVSPNSWKISRLIRARWMAPQRRPTPRSAAALR